MLLPFIPKYTVITNCIVIITLANTYYIYIYVLSVINM